MKTTIAIAASLLLSATMVSATLLKYESFNYNLPENAPLNGAGGWSGSAGKPGTFSTLNGTLPQTLQPSTGGALRLGPAQTAVQEPWLTPGSEDPDFTSVGNPTKGTYWYSMTITTGRDLAGANFNIFGGDKAVPKIQNGWGIRIDCAAEETGPEVRPTRSIRILTPQGDGQSNPAVFTCDLNTTQFFIIGKLVFNSARKGKHTNTIWVNPKNWSSEAALGAGKSLTKTTVEAYGSDFLVPDQATPRLSARAFSSSAYPDNEVYWDEVRIGTTLADVVPAAATQTK